MKKTSEKQNYSSTQKFRKYPPDRRSCQDKAKNLENNEQIFCFDPLRTFNLEISQTQNLLDGGRSVSIILASIGKGLWMTLGISWQSNEHLIVAYA